jgi:thiol-disulfide isomerase/thioredoxin
MKTPLLVLAGVLGILCPGCSKQETTGPAPILPPAKLLEGGWKASWSPEGRQIVYGRGAGQGLERLDFLSRQTTPVLAPGKDASWSPSGRWIAFVREDFFNSYLTEQVWVTDVEGKSARRVMNGGFPSWSKDGKKLFAHSRQQNQILAVNPEDPAARPGVFFSNTPSWYFSVSPDETRVAFGCAGRLEICERASGKTLANWPVPQARGLLPAWSPDGKLIAFGGFDGSQLGLWVVDASTMKGAQIFEGDYTMPAWNRDGGWLAFDSRSGEREIWTVGRPYLEAKLLEPKTTPSPASLVPQNPPPSPADTTSLAGQPAPEFNLQSLDGSPIALSQLKGNVVVLDFWATWCPPCRKSLPHLQHISQDSDLRQKGLRVISVNVRETKDKVQEFLKQNGYGFAVALDSDGATSQKYLVQGIPTTIVVDGAGVINRVFVGFGDQSEGQLDAAIRGLLGGG